MLTTSFTTTTTAPSIDRSLRESLPLRVSPDSVVGTAAPRVPMLSAASEHTLTLPDGLRLFYRAWMPEEGFSRAVILLHRGHEHSGRLSDVVHALGLHDTAVFAWDARGHGRSGGRRGHAESFQQLVRDLDVFARAVTAEHGVDLPATSVVAHSVGAVIAATWVHDYAPAIRDLVLVTPAFRVRLYVPFAWPALRLWQRLLGERPGVIKSYVRPGLLTHDPDQARRYADDPLITRDISVPVLLGMREAAERVVADAAAIRVPTLVLSGGSDWVVHTGPQRTFFDRLGSACKQMHIFPGFYHDILHERDRHQVLDAVRSFISRDIEQDPQRPSLLTADRGGHTRIEYDRLCRPLPAASPRKLVYSLTELALATAGRLSNGIRTGWRSGFDSGLSLDYVYRNQAQGALGIGRLFDRWYLESPGWRGIRQRRVHLDRMLRRAIAATHEHGRKAHILDIASGPGRYVLDVLATMPQEGVSACLRDHDVWNVDAARRLAASRGMGHVACEVADAFDASGLRAVEPSPTISIVSGLFELIPENARVAITLDVLAEIMPPGGFLIYTNQPWHPQLELIARTLRNRDGNPWIMRRRTQEEMDTLVEAAGFEKVDMLIDNSGIFTVSLARIAPAS